MMAGRFRPDPRARLVFVAILAVWAVAPFLLHGRLAQDAVPFVTAGQLARHHPDAVYASHMKDLYDLPPAFARKSCELSPAGTKCSSVSVAYVSAPEAMPFSVVLGWLGATWGVLAMRLVAGLSLAGGMWALWTLLAHRSRHAGTALAVTALGLTPMAMISVSLGQNSPLLFLSACLGIERTEQSNRRAAGVALVWVAIVAFKAFPVVLLALLVWRARWRMLGWCVAAGAVLAGSAALVGPFRWYRQFVVASRLLSKFSLVNPYNGAFDAAVHTVSASFVDNRAYEPVSLALRAVLVVVLWRWAVRKTSLDVQWAWASLALLLFVPLVWWHYLWVAIAAWALALAGRRRLETWAVWSLPALAIVTVPISITNARHSAVPWAQALFLVACLVAVPVLARSEPLTDERRGASPAAPQPALADR